jgi:hypothetical protein
MRFKTLALGGLLASGLALCSCASIVNPISQTQVYQLENAYGIAQAQGVAYVQFKRCAPGTHIGPTNLCSTAQGVVQIGKADKAARTALDAAQTFVTQNPTLDASSVISAAQTALQTLQSIETTLDVEGH